ncbi:MAG TPA: CoA ester lyase [Candidatus Eisenbacteria bacterium]|nr:CoA ester lyase [Candidatus Eisenbacteria bacterium]
MSTSTAPEASLLRSLLFAPATKAERLAKAAISGADAVIADLEDAVAPAEKDAARGSALRWLRGPAAPAVARCLRSNGLRTPEGLRDVLALVESGAAPDFLVVPKVESPQELGILDALLAGPTRFLPLIETARGLSRAERIAAHPRVAGLLLGGADLAADLGATLDWEALLWARSRLVQAAATAGVAVIDVPHLVLEDGTALAAECARVRRLGFTGKLAIHPKQVAAINAAFTPAGDEVLRARRIVDAAEAAGGGVCVVDGKMVDAPVLRAARRTLALAARRPS